MSYNQPYGGVGYPSPMLDEAREKTRLGPSDGQQVYADTSVNDAIKALAHDHALGNQFRIIKQNLGAGAQADPLRITFPVSRICIQAWGAKMQLWLSESPNGDCDFEIDPAQGPVIIGGTGQPMNFVIKAAGAGRFTFYPTAYGG